MGADRQLIDWKQIVDYFHYLDKGSDRILVEELGQMIIEYRLGYKALPMVAITLIQPFPGIHEGIITTSPDDLEFGLSGLHWTLYYIARLPEFPAYQQQFRVIGLQSLSKIRRILYHLPDGWLGLLVESHHFVILNHRVGMDAQK